MTIFSYNENYKKKPPKDEYFYYVAKLEQGKYSSVIEWHYSEGQGTYFLVLTYVDNVQADCFEPEGNILNLTREEILDYLEHINYETMLADEAEEESE